MAMAILLFLSAKIDKFSWIQPALFLVATPIAIMDDYRGFYGLGFFALAILLLYRIAFFQNHKAVKLGILLVIFYASETVSALKMGKNSFASFFPLFFMTAFLLLLYFAYEEKLIVYLKEPKPVISLAARGFTPLEASYIFAVIAGKTAKEMAYEMQVSESTARNNIARSFHKLGLNDRHEFTILSMKNDIVA